MAMGGSSLCLLAQGYRETDAALPGAGFSFLKPESWGQSKFARVLNVIS